MTNTYEITEEEYITIMDALSYAEQSAIHSEATIRFSEAKWNLIEQNENQWPYN